MVERRVGKAKALNIYYSDPDKEEADFIYQQCENVLMEEYERVTRLRGLEAMEGRFSELSCIAAGRMDIAVSFKKT